MIVDSHVHIGSVDRFDMKPEYVLDAMQRYGIDYSLVSSILGCEYTEQHEPLPDDWPYTQYSGNLPAVDFARQHVGKIGVLPWCKPHTEGFNEDFLRLMEEGGTLIKGLKFHPDYSMLPVNAPQVQPYLDYAAECGLPILVHSADDEWSQPRFVYEAAKAHPQVNFIMAHMGLGTDNAAAIELIGALPNLYGDTTWVPPASGLRLVQAYGAHKLLFGTDNPIDGPDTYAHPFYQGYFGAFREQLAAEEYELVMHGNAERLFRLQQ